MAHATDIVGWVYEADLHCESCAAARFPALAEDSEIRVEDGEGNEVTPVFLGEDAYAEDGAPYCCGDCGRALVEG